MYLFGHGAVLVEFLLTWCHWGAHSQIVEPKSKTVMILFSISWAPEISKTSTEDYGCVFDHVMMQDGPTPATNYQEAWLLGVLPRFPLHIFSEAALRFFLWKTPNTHCITHTHHPDVRHKQTRLWVTAAGRAVTSLSQCLVTKIITRPTTHLRQFWALTCWEPHYKAWDQAPALPYICIFVGNCKLFNTNISLNLVGSDGCW